MTTPTLDVLDVPPLPASAAPPTARRMIDNLLTAGGLLMTAVLITAGGLLIWAHTFVSSQVHDQLVAEQIFFPAAGSAAVAGPEYKAMRQYGGQQLTTGAQAEVYADHFIAVHLKEVAGGKTYAQLSSAAQADPTNTKLTGQVATMFKGETLRGLLLNAYAFDTMATIALFAAIGAFLGAGLMLVLSALGIAHIRRSRIPTLA
ncbi:MAG: hypothetical protein QOF05_1195 [Sphingomonadales bacterium]|nr:hypothetical protein [Sphingomonadales bacterium]